MPMFVVKRELPGITPDGVHGAGLRVKSCAAEMQKEGSDVHWLRSFFLPEAEQTHCYFEGPDETAIRDLNEGAQIPFIEISPVVEMTPALFNGARRVAALNTRTYFLPSRRFLADGDAKWLLGKEGD